MKNYRKIHYISSGIAFFPEFPSYVKNAFTWGEKANDMHYSAANNGEERLIIRRRIQKFLEKSRLGEITELFNIKEEHSDKIVILNKQRIEASRTTRWGKYIACDAIFTKVAGVTISIKPGDCTTAVVYCKDDRNKPIAGIIHSGRKGVDKELPRKAIEFLEYEMNVTPKNVHLGFVPHLHQDSRRFEHVDGLENKKAWEGFIEKKGGYYHPDEFGAALKQYLSAGVLTENVFHYNIDSFKAAARGEYFSHEYHQSQRKSGKIVPEWRFMVAIRLES